ncbi:MAG: hypothetical protein IKA71_00665, partial [Lentisphaeria bacterium]|nr:hypothetical protein [Lentisphaeria bacterium]
AALYMEGGTSTLTETVISENTAYRGGAFYVKGGTLTLNDALIDNNTATNLGSAIYADSAAAKITIDDSTISNNKCTGTAANNGGAIFSNNANVVISISNSTFSGNTSKNSDGGAAIYNNAGTINISNTVFASKSDTIYNKGTMNWSGKISLAGNVAIGVVSGVSKKINIADNTEISLLIADRTSDDSVIFHTPHVTLGKNVSFSVGMAANQASGSYKLIGTGNAITSVSVYDIALPETSVTLTVDAAPQKFGDNYLLLNTNADNALCLQVFDAIYAITSLDGKIKEIYSDAALPSITVNGTSQDKLEIKSGASFTGSAQAVNVTNSVLDINGAVFNNITSADVYGGIAITGQNSQMTIADTTISNTTAKSRGALQNRGASVSGGTATLTNVDFSNNKAEAAGSLGGAVFNYATNADYTASYEQNSGEFTNNSAENGGAIYNNSEMILQNVTFSGNKATGNGGAIYNAGVLTLTNTEFLSTTDTIYNQNALNISGTMDLRADLSGSGNVNLDNAAITVTDAIFGGTLLNLSGNNTISGGSLGFSEITFNAGAALAFTVNTDLSGITITVDGTGLEAGAVIATGVTGTLGDDDSVTNVEKGYLDIVDGNLVLKVKVEKDGVLEENSTGSVYGGGNDTENDGSDITQTIASGFKQGTVFAGSQNGSDGVVTTVITGGSIKKNLYGGGKVSADTTNLTINGGEVGMSVYGGFLASKATQKISLTNSNLTIDSGTFNSNIIGGSRVDVGTTALTHEVTNVNLTLNGGNFAGVGTSTDQGTGVFSAGYVVGTKSASDTMQYYVDTCNVTVDGAVLVPGVLYGGAYTSYCGYAEVGEVNITVESGSINTLVCGGWAQTNGLSKVGNIQVNINNGSVTELYAGGANADGNTEVTGMVDITISGNAAVTELFMGGKYNKSLVSGDVTVTITGDEKTFDRISGDGSHLENTGTSSLIIDTVVDVALLDGIDKLTITDGSQLNLTDADFAGLSEICFDLGDGMLDAADWTAMTGVSLDNFNGVKFMVDDTEMILADGVYSGSGFKVYEEDNSIKFAKLA